MRLVGMVRGLGLASLVLGGVALVLMLMLFATFNDIMHLWTS